MVRRIDSQHRRIGYAAPQQPLPATPMILYQFHELARSWMAPLTYWAEANAKAFSASGSWLSALPGAERVAAANELVYRIGFPQPGLWRLRFNSDWAGYSEEFGDFPSQDVEAAEQECDGMAWSAEISIGGYTLLIFSQDP